MAGSVSLTMGSRSGGRRQVVERIEAGKIGIRRRLRRLTGLLRDEKGATTRNMPAQKNHERKNKIPKLRF